jgi:hypothetical protein
VSTFLGLLGVVGFIVAIVSLAAAITWLVVRITPTSNGDDTAKEPSPSS